MYGQSPVKLKRRKEKQPQIPLEAGKDELRGAYGATMPTAH